MSASLGGTIQRNLSKCRAAPSRLSAPQQHVQVRNLPWVPLAYRKGGRSSPGPTGRSTPGPTGRSRPPPKAPKGRSSPRSRTPPSRRNRRGAPSHRPSFDPVSTTPPWHTTENGSTNNGPYGSLSFAIQSNKEALLGMQKELDLCIHRYRQSLGAEASANENSQGNPPMDGGGATSHQVTALLSKLSGLHANCTSTSWQHVDDTEDQYREVGKLTNEMINLSTKIQNLVLKEMAQQGDKHEEHVLYFYCSLAEQLLLSLVEMQADRMAFVDAAALAKNEEESKTSSRFGILGWLKEKVFAQTEEPQQDTDETNTQPMAHEDPLCVPRLEHFHGVASIVLDTLRQELKDPQQSPFRKIRRAQRLQQLLEKTDPDINTVRTLLNAYVLIGSYETARSCEKLANKYPEMREELFGLVLHAYFAAAKSSPRMQERSKAAVRADELVRLRWIDSPQDYEEKKFVHCTKALLCLNAVGGDAIPGICKRADLLASMCVGNLEDLFRNGNLEGLWKIAPSNLTLPLLNCLVLVYASSRDPSRVNLSKRLLQILLEDSDFKENVEVPYPDVRTCKAVLAGLVGINDRRIRWTRVSSPDEDTNRASKHLKDSSPENLEYGMDLLDHMFARPQCWPDQSYFHSLFRLLLMARPNETGRAADKLLSKMHIRECFGRAGCSWTLVTRKTYHYVLRAWLASAEAGHPGSAKRALALLELMEAQSLPLLTAADKVNAHGSTIYRYSCAPDRSTYQLLLKICGSVEVPAETEEALDIALLVDQRMKKHGIPPTSDTYSLLFACCAKLLPEKSRRRQNVTQQLLEDARKQGNVNVAVLERGRGIKGEESDGGKSKPKDGPASKPGSGGGLLSDLV